MLRKILIIITVFNSILSFSQDKDSGVINSCSVNLKVLSPPSSGDSDPSAVKKWFIINVEFTPAEELNEGNPNGYQFCDDLEVVYEAIITEPSLDKDYYLSGKTSLSGVCFDGNRKYTAGYIPPFVIDKIKRRKVQYDRKYFDNVMIKVTLLINGEKAAQAFYPAKTEGIDTKFSDKMSSLKIEKIKDSIIGRKNTPWMALNFDKYEWVK